MPSNLNKGHKMKKTLRDTFNRIGGNRLNEAYAWERQPGKPLPTMADVKAAHESKSLREADEDGKPWESKDGWDEDWFEDTGVMEALDLAQRIQYEIKNARRGSYIDEDSIFAMKYALGEIQKMLRDANDNIDAEIPDDMWDQL